VRASRLSIFLLIVGSISSGCVRDPADAVQRWVRPAERQFAEHYVALWQRDELDSAFALLAPELQTDTARIILAQVVGLLLGRTFDSVAVIGVNVRTVDDSARHVNLTYQALDSAQYYVMNVASRLEQDGYVVEGFSAYPIATSLFELNALSFSGKSPLHYICLALAGLMFLITIATAISVFATRGMPKRWLWGLVALIASPVFTLNWTTGAASINAMSFVFFGAALARSGPAAPWMVSLAFPVGALVALWRRTRWKAGIEAAT
jgi:hypothetical protein